MRVTVTGIGFLGAGSILQRGAVIRGLNTAASLWAVAAIGLSVGGGLYTLSVAAAVLILVILAILGPLERKYRDYLKVHVVRLVAPTGTLTMNRLKEVLGARADNIKHLVTERGPVHDTEVVTIEFRNTSRLEYNAIVNDILGIPQVTEEQAVQ